MEEVYVHIKVLISCIFMYELNVTRRDSIFLSFPFFSTVVRRYSNTRIRIAVEQRHRYDLRLYSLSLFPLLNIISFLTVYSLFCSNRFTIYSLLNHNQARNKCSPLISWIRVAKMRNRTSLQFLKFLQASYIIIVAPEIDQKRQVYAGNSESFKH